MQKYPFFDHPDAERVYTKTIMRPIELGGRRQIETLVVLVVEYDPSKVDPASAPQNSDMKCLYSELEDVLRELDDELNQVELKPSALSLR